MEEKDFLTENIMSIS